MHCSRKILASFVGVLVASAAVGCQSPTSSAVAPTAADTKTPAEKPAAESGSKAATKEELEAQLQKSLDTALKKPGNPYANEGKEPVPSKGANGEPDLSQEQGCVTWRWTTINPEWKRDPLTWDGNTRTLTYEGSTKRFDASGRVHDFGEGSAQLTYDSAGNVSFRGEQPKPVKEMSFYYSNTYDKLKRLTRVELALRAVGTNKPAAGTPHRVYHYDDAGRVSKMEIQVRLNGPLVSADLAYDAQGRLTQIEWKGSAESQLERFEYDAQGRLAKYERDGLVLAGGVPRDGVLDWQQWFTYDADGHTVRVEGVDGPDPAKSKHDITLFSPSCGEIGRIAPDFLLYPYVPLPEASMPHWVP